MAKRDRRRLGKATSLRGKGIDLVVDTAGDVEAAAVRTPGQAVKRVVDAQGLHQAGARFAQVVDEDELARLLGNHLAVGTVIFVIAAGQDKHALAVGAGAHGARAVSDIVGMGADAGAQRREDRARRRQGRQALTGWKLLRRRRPGKAGRHGQGEQKRLGRHGANLRKRCVLARLRDALMTVGLVAYETTSLQSNNASAQGNGGRRRTPIPKATL